MFVIFLLISFEAGIFADKPELKFDKDGSFKILQFSDIHLPQTNEPRTIAAMNNILDSEKPNFVVITGDLVSKRSCSSFEDIKRVSDIIAQPFESRGILWAVTLGNHDRDNLSEMGVSQDKIIELYMTYKHNINKQNPPNV